MNLLRGVGRLLLGGFFIVNGVKAVKDPAQFAAAAEPIKQRFVPLVERALPPEASAYVPENTETLVRLNGAASILGGLGMATGLSRRGGAYLAAASMLPHVLAADPRGATAAEKEARRSIFVRNLALLGAAVVVSQDTAGKPSLAWRAADTRRRIAREADRAAASVSKGAERTGRSVRRGAERTSRAVAKDVRQFKREAALQARLARKNIEAALP